MPKAPPEDHRPARAVLHAPYPLPFIVTRPPLTASKSLPVLSNSGITVPTVPLISALGINNDPIAIESGPLSSASTSIAKFPFFDNDKTLNFEKGKTAFTTSLPYPLIAKSDKIDKTGEEKRKRRQNKKLLLLKPHKQQGQKVDNDDGDGDGDGESSEWELLSNFSENVDKDQKDLLELTKQIGKISADGELDDDDPNQDENNLLIYSFASSCKQGQFDWIQSDLVEPFTQTQSALSVNQATSNNHQSTRPAGDNDNNGVDDYGEDEPDELLSILDDIHEEPIPIHTSIPNASKINEPIATQGPAWDVVSDVVSSFWNDDTDADEADQEDDVKNFLKTTKAITPSESASQILRNFKNRRKQPDKPLFLGQTNQAPFTFIPPASPKKAHSQSSLGDNYHVSGDGDNGYISEATSVRTVKQIRRSKVKRTRMKTQQKDKGKQIKRERSMTPMQRDYQRTERSPQRTPRPAVPNNLSGLSYLDKASIANRQQIDLSYNNTVPQQSMLGLESFLFAPFAPILQTSEVLSSPEFQLTNRNISNRSVPAHDGRAISWSPQPILVDPKTSQTQTQGNTSWPRELPERENVIPSNSSSLMGKHMYSTSDDDVPMPTALSRILSQQQQLPKDSRKNHLNRDRDDMDVPLGKACHNYLYLRKLMAAKKKKGMNKYIDKHKRVKEVINQERNGYQAESGSSAPVRMPQPFFANMDNPHPQAQEQAQVRHDNQTNQPQPQHQQPFTASWNANTQISQQSIQAQIQFQAQQMFNNMLLQFAQRSASQVQTQAQAQAQGQVRNIPNQPTMLSYNPGIPMNFIPQFNSSILSNSPSSYLNQGSFSQIGPQQSFHQKANLSHSVAPPPPPTQRSQQPYGFPTPGPSPQAPTPASYVFTPKSPNVVEDRKPLRKRRRSISPTSAHDLLMQKTTSKSPFVNPAPRPIITTNNDRLLSPAQIHSPDQWKQNIPNLIYSNSKNHEEIQQNYNEDDDDDEEEEHKGWSNMMFNIGLKSQNNNSTKRDEDAEDEETKIKYERREQWLEEERERYSSLAAGQKVIDRKGKGKQILR